MIKSLTKNPFLDSVDRLKSRKLHERAMSSGGFSRKVIKKFGRRKK